MEFILSNKEEHWGEFFVYSRTRNPIRPIVMDVVPLSENQRGI